MLDYLSTHRIHDDVHVTNDRFKRRRVIVNRFCAERANELAIAPRRRADDVCAFPFGKLHGIQSNAARRAMHQDALSRLYVGRFNDRLPGNQRAHGNRRGFFKGQMRGFGLHLAGRGNGVFGVTAGDKAKHALPRLERRDILAGRLDNPSTFKAGYPWEGKWHKLFKVTGAHGGIGGIDTCRQDSNQHLIGLRLRTRRLLKHEDLRSTILMKTNSLHR